MTTLNTTSDMSAVGALATGESWIELVPAVHGDPRQISFPAVIEPRRHHGVWVRPRLRRNVAEAMCEWLNLVYPTDPDWYPLARFEGDLLVVFTGDSAHHRHEIAAEVDGRYPLGELGRWFLSGPTRARRSRRCGARRHPRQPSEGETLVSCDPRTHSRNVFPGRVEIPADTGRCVVILRPEVADAVADYCTRANQDLPDDYPLVHFDGDTLVHVHQHLRAREGYLPWRIEPGADGTYRIDSDEWIFRMAPRKSEGIPFSFRLHQPRRGTWA
ncbi:Uncharacterised protein [Amycolatopsis camponoti]|uniref:Uncharacterized protein n=1 Tax=Amycolatopsis camponoti TaxID=2606593 RepID=A0A6I8LZ06_9PSEU|nr:hypothetical protein [Amycolatopsis camponoti]VVJ22696.1 Uncharacterised protein [Amycolatopsis camponoti]